MTAAPTTPSPRSPTPARPRRRAVGGDLKLATFNVLNYFNTTGEAYNLAHPGACTFFTDRAGNPIAVNTCTPTGPRGAANTASLTRQQAKIVRAINNMDADIVSLEEIENSVALGEADRDDAVLRSGGGTQRGRGQHAVEVRPVAGRDCRTSRSRTSSGRPSSSTPTRTSRVGQSEVLVGTAVLRQRARAAGPGVQGRGRSGRRGVRGRGQPLQVQELRTGGTGLNADSGDGQGAFNGDRNRQAADLVTFANAFAATRGTQRIFLSGDFNSYTKEDPMQVLYAAGFDAIESDTANEWSYSFSGLSGSLDHVLANGAAMDMVTGADIWEINANESPAYQYSRFNYNVTNFYAATPYAASDHNPEIVGIDTGPSAAEEHPDPRHQRLPRPDHSQPDRRRGRRRGARWSGQATAGPRTPTRSSRQRVTSSVRRRSSPSSRRTSRRSTRSTRPVSTCPRWATTSSTRGTTTWSTA